jgi:hypothetical protein
MRSQDATSSARGRATISSPFPPTGRPDVEGDRRRRGDRGVRYSVSLTLFMNDPGKPRLEACSLGRSQRMIHNLFLSSVPIHLLAFTVSPGGHDGSDRMPEAGLDMPVRHRVARPHAVDPVSKMRLAVVAQMRGWQLPLFQGRLPTGLFPSSPFLPDLRIGQRDPAWFARE